jgi:tRNA pseudouridine(55) synthase
MAPAVPLEGVLLVDKSLGPTSMDVCGRVRSALRKGGAPKGIKVGHAGTLDPLASGLVIVLVGKATRLSEAAMQGAKEYLTEIDLAHESDSHDLETEARQVTLTPIAEAAVREAVSTFVGTIQQLPPGHSAMRVGGMRAYHFARRGEAPPHPAAPGAYRRDRRAFVPVADRASPGRVRQGGRISAASPAISGPGLARAGCCGRCGARAWARVPSNRPFRLTTCPAP